MPRTARIAPGGLVYHVLNRAIGKKRLFAKDTDFEAFQRVMVEAHSRHPIQILTYCILSSHWQFVVWPQHEGQMSAFFRWLTHTHAMRWRVAHGTVGDGPVYKGRFKSFPVQCDEHLLAVLRYVERSPVGAGLVDRAEDWRWGALWTKRRGDRALKALLTPWPVDRPANWLARVNALQSAKELERLGTSVTRGQPYGGDGWVKRTAKELNLEHTLRPEGRPPKRQESGAGRKK
jgi:putative transposase